MNENDRTSAIGLARYARDYYDAALAADDVLGRRKGYEIVAPAPVLFLVAHSIELVLKSYLRYKGFTVDELKKLSHRLDECWRVASDNGIKEHVTLIDSDLSVLSLISDLHASTDWTSPEIVDTQNSPYHNEIWRCVYERREEEVRQGI